MKTTILFLVLTILIFNTYGFSQSKFSYITVEFKYSTNDSINFKIDTTGLIDSHKIEINNHILIKKFKKENQLLNALGQIGWEFLFFSYYPNRISPASTYDGRPLKNHYNIYNRDEGRKAYFKKTD